LEKTQRDVHLSKVHLPTGCPENIFGLSMGLMLLPQFFFHKWFLFVLSVVTTLQNFVRLFTRSHEENCKQLDLEKKKALKEAEENSKQLDLEKKKAQKEAETDKTKNKSDNVEGCKNESENDKPSIKESANEKAKLNNSIKELDISLKPPAQTASAK
jgi:curved DNA-binding protein CbpA